MAKFSYVVSPDSGLNRADRFTAGNADHALVFSGTGEKNDTITISWMQPGSTTAKTATVKVATNGTWSLTTPTLPDGAYNFTIKETGKQPTTVSVPTWTLDTKTNVSIDGIGPDTGRSTTDGVTKGGVAQTVFGTAEAGDIVLVTYVDAKGAKGIIGTTTADSSGKWSLKAPVAADGTYTLTALATDKAGNLATSQFKVVLDSVAPTAPTLTVKGDDGGVVTSTIDSTLHVSGTAEANSLVAVTWQNAAGQTGALTSTAGANGAWSVDTGTLAIGNYTFTAKATDVAGNVSKASAAFNFKVDAPANPAPDVSKLPAEITVTEDQGLVNGLYEVDLKHFITDDDPFTLSLTTKTKQAKLDPATGILRISAGSLELAAGEQVTLTLAGIALDQDSVSPASSNFTLNLKLVGVNDAPVYSPPPTPFTFPENIGRSALIDLKTVFQDLDGDALTYSLVGGRNGEDRPLADGLLTVDPGRRENLAEGESRVDQYVVKATDPSGASTTQTIDVTITGVNDAPYTLNDVVHFTEGTGSQTFDMRSFFADPDGDTLTFKAMTAVPGVTLSGTGSLIIDTNDPFYDDLDTGANRVQIIRLEVDDGHGGVLTETVAIVVKGVTDEPPPPTIVKVMPGGSYTASTGVDYFIFDAKASSSTGNSSVGHISGFDPAADKIILANIATDVGLMSEFVSPGEYHNTFYYNPSNTSEYSIISREVGLDEIYTRFGSYNAPEYNQLAATIDWGTTDINQIRSSIIVLSGDYLS